MADALRITGLYETQQMILAVPADIEKALPRALLAPAAVIEQELLWNLPASAKGHDERSPYPPLSSSFVKDILMFKPENVGVASVGFGDAGPVALYLEYGHRIVTHHGVASGKRTVPHPFMRRSTDECADAAMDAFAVAIAAAVEKT